MVKIKFNTNAISGSLQEEKKEAIAFVERKLNDLNLDYKWIAEENKIDFVSKIWSTYSHYDSQSDSERDKTNKVDNLFGNKNWFEVICQAQYKEDVNLIKEFLGKAIAAFGSKETEEFRKIVGKLNKWEIELKKENVDWNKANTLKNEIVSFTHDNQDGAAQTYQVSRYIFPSEALLSEIEKQNRKSTPTKNANDDARFDYSTFQELKEGKHEIIRKYKELATKIFDNYNDRKNRVIKKEYENIDVQLSREIASGDWNLEDFWDTDNSYTSESYRKQCKQKNQIGLRSRARIIEIMQQLIAKAEQEQGNNDKKRKREEVDNSSDANKRSRSGKEEKDFEQLVSEKNDQKDQATNQKIDSILSAAKKESDPQKLANLLEQIEKENGGKEIEESKKNEIRELKARMFDSNPQAKQEVISKLNNLLSQSNLRKEEHDKIAKEVEDLDKEENNQEIIKKEESIVEKIGIADAQKKLNELVAKAKSFLQSNLLDKFQAVKKEVVQFVTDNGYNHKVYQLNKSEIDQLFAQTSSEQRPQGPTWKKVIVPVSLLIITTTAIAIIAAMVVKKRKENKVKIK